MPTNRKRRSRTPTGVYTHEHYGLQMFVGKDYFEDAYGNGADFDRELCEQHWLQHRDEILDYYLTVYNKGGSFPAMPWAWYVFEGDDPHEWDRLHDEMRGWRRPSGEQ
jgi:hypothetical protein